MARYIFKSLYVLFAIAAIAAIEVAMIRLSSGWFYGPAITLLWLILGAAAGIIVFLPLKKSPILGAAIGTTISFCLALHCLI